jgi:ADP-heptose:LPS heptosyltransferase
MVKRVLIANIFGIGDVLFTTPLINSIKSIYPSARIDYLCNARVRPLLSAHPWIDDIYVYEKDEVLKLWERSKLDVLGNLKDLFLKIRGRHYDIMFDMTLSRKFGLFFALTGIPRRIGLDYKKRGIFLNRKTAFAGFEGRHVAEYYGSLMTLAGMDPVRPRMYLPLRQPLEAWAEGYISRNFRSGRPVVALIPGGGESWGPNSFLKRWPAEKFALAASKLEEKIPCSFLVGGSHQEEDLCIETARGIKGERALVVTDLPLDHYAALLGHVDVVLCNDGGPLHIASSRGTDTVSVFGPVDEKVYGPFAEKGSHKVLSSFSAKCRPCYRKFKIGECNNAMACLRDITAEQAAEACYVMLEKS